MQKITSIDYHRNGIGGDGFYVALIEDTDLDHPLVAIVPSSAVESGKASSETGLYQSYVLDPAKAAAGDIAFGSNSWRGDTYFDLVVAAARERAAA